MKGFEARLASGVGISVAEVVLFIVEQAEVTTKEEISRAEVIFFIYKRLIKVKILILTKIKNHKTMRTLILPLCAALLLLSCDSKNESPISINLNPGKIDRPA